MMMKLVLFLCCAVLMGCATTQLSWDSPYRQPGTLKDGDILHIPTGILVEQDQLMDHLKQSKIVYVGETHDNINAHRIQLEILKAMHEDHPGQVAVGMEMLKRSSQEAADQWSVGAMDEKEWVRTWINDWTNDFAYYRDILLFIRDNRIPLVALRASDDWTDAVKKTPQEKANNGQEREPLPEMDFHDEYHRSHIEAVYQKHPHGGGDFEAFYKVQVLWDESMAQSVVDYLSTEEGREKQVIVFAGAQHVEHGFGIPRRVFRRMPLPYSIVVPLTLTTSPKHQPRMLDVTLPDVPLFPGDFLWTVVHEDLKSEKVYLGVMINKADDGIKIIGTTKGSVAEKAGLQKDDVIFAFDGEEVSTPFDLTYAIGKKKPGDQGVIDVRRGQETLRFEVTFDKWKGHF